MTPSRDFTVALLMEDASGAKDVSAALRQAGVFAHFYRELDEFWVACRTQMPDLAVVDVACMSQGETQFKNHPCVRDGSLCTVFYHREETRFLLKSTAGLPTYSHVDGDIALPIQLLALVERRKHELELENRNRELEERVSRLQFRSARLLGEKSSSEQFKSYFDFITGLVTEVEEEARAKEFAPALFDRLVDWAPVRQVGMYELGLNRQKLTAPEMNRKKWLALPALWLGKECANGIEPFAIDMGWQVARDVFENEPVELRLFGGGAHPDLLVYMEVDRERVADFPWNLLANMLSGAWRQWRLARQAPRPVMQVRPVWEALDVLDQLHFQPAESGEKVMLLSLTPLLNLVKKKTSNRFYYTAFYNELFLNLGERLHESTRFTFCGPWHILVFAKPPYMEREHGQLMDLVTSFSFWRFFEDEALVLGEEAKPTLRVLAPSAVNYLRVLEREFDEFPILEAQAKMQGRSTPPARPVL